MLEIDGVWVRRGSLDVVRDASLRIAERSIVGLIGLNGAGKSSLLAALAGDLPFLTGTVRLDGVDLGGSPAWERCRAGLVLVPAGRQLFKQLSVSDNLLVGGHLLDRAQRDVELQACYELFPILWEKRSQSAGELSGGQQQMLAVARGLMARPRVLMLDEPSEGLAPIIVDQLFEAIARLREEKGLTLVLAEQNAGVVDVLDEVALMTDGALSPAKAVESTDADEIASYMFGGVH